MDQGQLPSLNISKTNQFYNVNCILLSCTKEHILFYFYFRHAAKQTRFNTNTLISLHWMDKVLNIQLWYSSFMFEHIRPHAHKNTQKTDSRCTDGVFRADSSLPPFRTKCMCGHEFGPVRSEAVMVSVSCCRVMKLPSASKTGSIW